MVWFKHKYEVVVKLYINISLIIKRKTQNLNNYDEKVLFKNLFKCLYFPTKNNQGKIMLTLLQKVTSGHAKNKI